MPNDSENIATGAAVHLCTSVDDHAIHSAQRTLLRPMARLVGSQSLLTVEQGWLGIRRREDCGSRSNIRSCLMAPPNQPAAVPGRGQFQVDSQLCTASTFREATVSRSEQDTVLPGTKSEQRLAVLDTLDYAFFGHRLL